MKQLLNVLCVLLFFSIILNRITFSNENTQSNNHYEPELTREQIINAAKSIDFDVDSFSNYDDNCPSIYNPEQNDIDNDGT